MAARSRKASNNRHQGATPLELLPPVDGPAGAPARKSSKGKCAWSPEEDEILRRAVALHDGKNWKKIATYLQGRTDVQCLHRWQKVLNPHLVKGGWTPEEDALIIQMVDELGLGKWSVIASHLPGRIGKQCRERWHNHLDPNINRSEWTQQEDEQLVLLHAEVGNQWAVLARSMPGRTDNAIKNRWNATLHKRVLSGDYNYLLQEGGQRVSQPQPSQEQRQDQQARQGSPPPPPPQQQQQAKPRTRKARPKAPALPYGLQQEAAAAGSTAAAAGRVPRGDADGCADSDEEWQASPDGKSRKRRRPSRAAASRKKQQHQPAEAGAGAGAAMAAGDWYAGCAAVDPAAAAAGAECGPDVPGFAAYGPVIAAAAAAGAADSAGAVAAAQMLAWEWAGEAAEAAAAAAGGGLTPQLADADGGWAGFRRQQSQSQSPHAGSHADQPDIVGRDRSTTPGLFAGATPKRKLAAGAAAAAAAAGAARQRKGGSTAHRADGCAGAAAGVDGAGVDGAGVDGAAVDAVADRLHAEEDAEALQAAEALASLDNSRSRSSSQPFNSPSNASSRRPQRSSMAAAAAAGAHMRQPDYAQEGCAALADGSGADTARQDGFDALQQLRSLAAGSSLLPLEQPEGGVSAGMVAALASMLLPGAAAAAAGTGAASNRAVLQQQDPHVSGQQQPQQESGSGDQGCAVAGEGREVGVPDLTEPTAYSWGLNTSSPLPAMLLQLPQQQGLECSLRDMLQERYGSSGELAAAAAATGCTPLEGACDGGGVGGGPGSVPATAAAAAAAAADVAQRRSKRSRLAEAQPGLQQLLATPNAVLASLLANPAAGAAEAGSAGGGDDYVSCFPALTPGGWNAEGGGPGSASGTEEQQQQQQQTTPSNMLISTQLGDGAFSVLQHLQTLLDSQQRSSRGSGSSRNSNQLQTTGGGSAPAAVGDALQQRRQQQRQQESAGEGQQVELQAGGNQQDESPTSPDEGLLQQGQQQGLGCLLNTPYPLLYRTANPGTHAEEEEQQQQQQQPGDNVVSAPCSSGGEAAVERGCNYKSAAAAIEDAARQSGPILQAAAMALAAAAAAAAGAAPAIGGLPPALTSSVGSVGQHF